jgi:hypothetical protein
MSEKEVRDFVESEVNACVDLWQSATTAKERRESSTRIGKLLKHRDERVRVADVFRLMEMKFGPPGRSADSDSE